MSNEHRDPVVVARYTTEFEAMLAKNMLSEAGVPVQVVGAMTAGFRAETPGIVKLIVPGDFEEQALILLIEHTKEVEDHADQGSDGDEIGDESADGDGIE